MRRLFETLETRTFFAHTLSVADFGATPNDGQNDSAAVQAALNRAQPGDAVSFPAGTWNLSSQITIPAHRKLIGQKGAIIKAGSGKYCFQTDPSDSEGIFIGGFEVAGRLLRIDNHYGGWSSAIEISGNTFDAIDLEKSSTEHETIFIANGAKNLFVHDNIINDEWGDGFILGYGYQNVRITGNTFNNGLEGIHYLGNFGTSDTLIVSGNVFNKMHRMAVELQGDGNHIFVQDNIINGAAIYSDFKQNMSTFGLSVATDGAKNITVRRNKIVSYDRADGTGLRIGIELAGTNIKCYDNDIEGTNAAITLNTSANSSVRDNRIVNSLAGVQNFAGRTSNSSIGNNGPDTELDWNPDARTTPVARVKGK